jgi:peptidyl-prolyl cis-trans isomerase A (cyclophilin A)
MHRIAIALSITLAVTACGKKDQSPETAKKVEAAKDKAGEAAEKVGEAAKAAGEAAKAAGEAATSAAKDAARKAQQAADRATAAAKVVKEGAVAAAAVAAGDMSAALLDPSKAKETAPDKFVAVFDTTKGKFEVEVTRAWAPNGADRFYNLIKIGFFKDIAIFRAIPGFMFQFGIHGNPQVSAAWRPARITDDKVNSAIASNNAGYLTFAKAGPNTRTTQMFINFGNNANLDGMGFPPIGKIINDGMSVAKKINTEYGEGAPSGRGPAQGMVQGRGNAYLKADFPNLDYIKTVTIK